MMPATLTPDALKRQTRLNAQTAREEKSLTTYLRDKASKEEKDAYRRAWQVGSKAGSGPGTVKELHAFMNRANG